MLKKIFYVFEAAAAFYLLLPAGSAWFYANNLRCVYVLCLAFLLAVLFAPLAIKIAVKYKLFDLPDARKIHLSPMPRIGGLAVFFAFLIAAVRTVHFPKELIGLFSGLTLVFIVEFLDDLKSNSAFLRLGTQVAAAIILIIAGVYIRVLPLFPGSVFLEHLLTVIWVVGIINAVNFLDGLDGLAAGLGVISGLSFFVIIYSSGQPELAYLILAFLGACLGFFMYNYRPAKIFLGDAGSTTIGFLLASFPLLGIWNTQNAVTGSVIPVLVLGLPIFDLLYTSVLRIGNGSVSTVKEWIEFTGKDHIHHRLLQAGLPQKQVLFFLYLLNLILCFSAIALVNASEEQAILLFFQACLLFGLIAVLMRQAKK